MAGRSLAAFGQELYLDESIQAIGSFADVHDRRQLHAGIAAILPHDSESTRNRVATKIIQRYFRNGKTGSDPFLKLVNGLKRESAKLDLLYWRTARTDAVIEAIADEVLYPYFVLGDIPAGYDAASFSMANTGTLFPVDPVISRDFVVEYARRMWGFASARSVALALRTMKQADMLDATSVALGRRHVLGYYPKPHPLSPEVFAYCLYEEFLGEDPAPVYSLDRIYNACLVKVFLLTRLQVESLLKTAERNGFIEMVSLPGGKHVRLKLESLGELVQKME